MEIADLRFELDGDGSWSAYSCVRDDDCPFEFVITVDHDGMFTVRHSDAELLGESQPRFPTFAETKEWCNARNRELASA